MVNLYELMRDYFRIFANRGCCHVSGTKAGVATGHGQSFKRKGIAVVALNKEVPYGPFVKGLREIPETAGLVRLDWPRLMKVYELRRLENTSA